MKRLNVSAGALRDLQSIYRQGVQLFGEAQALKYQRGLHDALAFLCEFPLASRVRPELGGRGYRSHRFNAHVIVYRISESDLYVVRVRHGREDWKDSDG